MNRLFVLAVALSVAIVGVNLKADEKASIKDVMKAHGKAGARNKVKAAIKAKKWDDAEAAAKDWVKLAEALGGNKPPKGDDEAWKKQAEAYDAAVKALAKAVAAKDAKAAAKADAAIGGSCAKCHKAHK